MEIGEGSCVRGIFNAESKNEKKKNVNPLIWKLLLRDNTDEIAAVTLSVIAEKLDDAQIN